MTSTTTGYGDMYPVTLGGRITAFLLMHTTLLFILPLLIGRIVNTMIPDQHAFTEDEQQEILADLRALKAKLDDEQPA